MVKIKRLPSLKEKKRYLVFRIHSKDSLEYHEVKSAVFSSLLNWFGESGLAEAKCRLIKNLWDGEKMTGYLSCSNKKTDDVKVALALVHQIGDQRVIFQVLKTAGTIKSGKEKAK